MRIKLVSLNFLYRASHMLFAFVAGVLVYQTAVVLAGLVVCFAYGVAVGVMVPPTDLAVELSPASLLLEQILLPPWWALSGLLAPWLGFALAAWLILHGQSSVKPNPVL